MGTFFAHGDATHAPHPHTPRAPSTPMAAKPELKYFNLRGVAEGVRLLFAAANKYDELKDTRFDVDVSKFSEGVNVASPAFAEAREAGILKPNMNRAPVMIVDGVTVGQSFAIERLSARRLGLYGANDIEGALIDMIGEHILDIRKAYQTAKAKGEEDVASWFSDKLPEWMDKLEATLGNQGYAVGGSLSWADVKLYHFVNEYFDNPEPLRATLKVCPKIEASVKAVADLPGIKAYYASRPVTPF